MAAAHRRHDISNRVWERLRPLLPGEAGKRGRQERPACSGQPSVSQRGVLDSAYRRSLAGPPAGLWGLEEHPSPVLPLAGPSTRLRRGVWERLLESVIDDPDFEWLMIGASYIKVHPHGAGACGGNQAMARTKGG